MTKLLNDLEKYPNFQHIIAAQIDVWPNHEDYLQHHFSNLDTPVLILTEEIAGLVSRLVGDRMVEYCEDYKWMCDNFFLEDVHFRKTGKYRLRNFTEVYEHVYGNHEYMSRYINGILFSQILWSNQAASFACYVNTFLPSLNEFDELLEIGPGHGLLLYFATKIEKLKSITGWDISRSSLDATANALRDLGVERPVELTLQNILETPSRKDAFNAVIFSEVLEHLDQPDVALNIVFQAMRPGGKLFLNVPVNSPAPDHIFLWNNPEEVIDLVGECGFEIEGTSFAPATGFSEADARRRKATINTLVVAKKPN